MNECQEYEGIYGIGYKDKEDNLYLYEESSLILIRLKNKDGTYDIGLMGKDDFSKDIGFSLLESISLKEWREFFSKISNEKAALNQIFFDMGYGLSFL